ncbi:unnamed protein product [Calypogeia fissa]
MADNDVWLSQQQQHQQQQQRFASTATGAMLLQQAKVGHVHELNEALVGKRKRGTVGDGGGGGGRDGDGGPGGGGAEGGGSGGGDHMLHPTTSLDSGRFLKRRNGAEGVVGGGGVSGQAGIDKGSGVGVETRKRKSLEKLGGAAATPSSEQQDGVSTPLTDSRSSKKRKGGGGGGEGSNGVELGEASDDGPIAQAGPALRLRFTRRGNAFAVTKKGPEGMAVEGAQNGEEDDGGADGEAQEGHALGEGYRSRGISDVGPSKPNRMEGDPSSSDDPIDQGRSQQPITDGTPNSLPARNPESRPPLTKEIYKIPSHAGWFSWMKIHNIERRALSEFFDGKSISKTPKIYKDYRDFIINKYRENMQRTLTFTEVRRMLIGDVNAIRRVFDFLDHWGLINHQVVQESNDQMPAGGPSSTQTVVEPIPAGMRMSLGPTPATPARSSQLDSFSAVSGLQSETLSSHKNVFTPTREDGVPSTAEASEKSAPRYNCMACGVDCTRVLFRCRKEHQPDYNLCPECYKNGKYGTGMVARDFTRVEARTEAFNDQWTTKETLSLLEAIMRYGDNWNQVAEHVGSKSRSDCVERFIQLPFGDRFLNDEGAFQPNPKFEENTTSTSVGGIDVLAEVHGGEASVTSVATEHVVMDGNGTPATPKSTVAPVMDGPSPFEDASNPLLAQVAFMSAAVGPRVAAAAAEAAILAIAEEEPAVANLPLMNGHSVQSSVLKEGVNTGRQNSESLKESSRPETRHDALSQPGLQHLFGEKDKDGIPSVAQVKASIGTALGAAAANAKLLADQEERKMELLMSDIIENQLKRLHAKMEHFEELEMLVEKERLQLEQSRQLLYAHHIQFAESRFYLNRERHG